MESAFASQPSFNCALIRRRPQQLQHLLLLLLPCLFGSRAQRKRTGVSLQPPLQDPPRSPLGRGPFGAVPWLPWQTSGSENRCWGTGESLYLSAFPSTAEKLGLLLPFRPPRPHFAWPLPPSFALALPQTFTILLPTPSPTTSPHRRPRWEPGNGCKRKPVASPGKLSLPAFPSSPQLLLSFTILSLFSGHRPYFFPYCLKNNSEKCA